MKLLVAIPADSPYRLDTLLWAARGGFDLRIFIPQGTDTKKYTEALENANYENFLDLRHDMLIAQTNALTYAMQNGYDIMAVIPAYLEKWNDTEDENTMIIEFAKDLAEVRKRMGSDTTVHHVEFDNGTRVVRVVKL